MALTYRLAKSIFNCVAAYNADKAFIQLNNIVNGKSGPT